MQQQVQQVQQVQLQGTLGRTGLPWQQPPLLHHQPQTTVAAVLGPSTRPPPPVKPRQVCLHRVYFSHDSSLVPCAKER